MWAVTAETSNGFTPMCLPHMLGDARVRARVVAIGASAGRIGLQRKPSGRCHMANRALGLIP